VAFLLARFDPLHVGSFGQNNRLHAAGGVALDFVVAEKTD